MLDLVVRVIFFFFFQAEDGIRDYKVTGVQTCALPISGPPPNTTGLTSTFETGTTEGWTSRTGTEIVAPSSADAHSGGFSLLTTNRTAAFRGPNFNVTSVMFNGSRYRVSVWAKLAAGAAP